MTEHLGRNDIESALNPIEKIAEEVKELAIAVEALRRIVFQDFDSEPMGGWDDA